MRKFSFILFYFLTTFVCFSQNEYLEPVRDFKEYDGVLKKYYDNVFIKLHEGFTKKPIAMYTSMPSFSSEYAFSVETLDGKHYIISNRFSENYWYAKKRNKVRLITNKVEIDNELYLKISNLFQLVAQQIKKPEEESMGLDGTTYYFSTINNNGEVKTGETWSPFKSTLLYKLVEISDNLFSYGEGEDISKIEILKEIEKLIEKLNQ